MYANIHQPQNLQLTPSRQKLHAGRQERSTPIRSESAKAAVTPKSRRSKPGRTHSTSSLPTSSLPQLLVPTKKVQGWLDAKESPFKQSDNLYYGKLGINTSPAILRALKCCPSARADTNVDPGDALAYTSAHAAATRWQSILVLVAQYL